MEMIRICYLLCLVTLICVATLERKPAIARTLIGDEFGSYHLDTNDQLADYVRRNCRQELVEIEARLGDFDLSFQWKKNGNDTHSVTVLRQTRPQGTSASLPPHLELALLDCLSYSDLAFHAYSNTKHDNLGQSSVPRRYLAHNSRKHRAIRHDLAPSPTPFSQPLLSPSPSQSSPAPSPANASSPSLAPSESPSSPAPAHDSDDPIILPELLEPPPPSTPKQSNPRVGLPPSSPRSDSKVSPPKEEENNDANKLIAIGTIVAGLVAVLSLLILCLVIRRKRVGPVDNQRDEKPLLKLCSDSPVGSSANSNNKDFGRTKSFNNASGKPDGQHGSTLAGIPENGANAISSLPIPPGNSAAFPPPPPPAAPPPPPPKLKPPVPPPLRGARLPPAPLKAEGKKPHHRGASSSEEGSEITGDSDAPKTKLKPFFWDKVVGNADHSMVWDEIRAGSFQFNEEMIESLFGYVPEDKNKNDQRSRSHNASQVQYIRIIDPKKAQNLSILLKALNVTTEEVHDALLEGNELPAELLQTLVKMAPTTEEELKLRLFNGDLSQLGPAERFLILLVDIPFPFKRMEFLMFMMSHKEEVAGIKESFATLEVACKELKNSRLFMKLLEAVLKTGNRMNDGTYRGGAQAFKLDTLLKLSDVKGTDGKTTLLHFVVQEIVRTEGIKAGRAAKEKLSISSMKSDDFINDPAVDITEDHNSLGLQVVSHLSSELENVKKAAAVDSDGLTSSVARLAESLLKAKDFLNDEVQNVEKKDGFCQVLEDFAKNAEGEITWLMEEEKRVTALVRKTADYFHGNSGKEEGLRLFVIVRDFLMMVDRVCAQLKSAFLKPAWTPSQEVLLKSPTQEVPQQSINDIRQRLFPAIAERRMDESSSDSDDEDSD